MAQKIRKAYPFHFFRFGDGAIECMYVFGAGRTADGEIYSPILSAGLKHSWWQLCKAPGSLPGDWSSASFGNDRSTEYPEFLEKLKMEADGYHVEAWMHFESLLMMRQSDALIDFYSAVADDPRKKVYLGPAEHQQAAIQLGCKHLVTPMKDLYVHLPKLRDLLLISGFEILLYAAGLAGNILIGDLVEKFPDRTYVHLGSAWDPIARGRTRSGQLSRGQALDVLAKCTAS